MKKGDEIYIPSRKKRRTKTIEDINAIESSQDVDKSSHSTTEGKQFKTNRNHIPNFRLKCAGVIASLSTPNSERIPLMLTDVQHLLLHSLLGNLNLTQPPRWYVLDKCGRISQTMCIVLEGISIKHLETYSHEMVHLHNIFNDFIEVVTPSLYGGSLVQELALVPLSETEKESLIQKYGSMNLALEVRKDLMVMMRAVFPIGSKDNSENGLVSEDKFPRTQLLLSAWQMVEENYPIPLRGKLKNAYSDYVMTKEEYLPVTANSPLFGIDCEMCITNAGSELTRISVVNEKHETIYESLVKPYNEITDYLTRYSGITKTLLNDVSKRLEDVQKDLRKILPADAILVGQSLNTDLHALKMMHPYIIDTSLVYNFTGERTRKPKLKALAKEFLHEDIQCGKKGHCSVEDSLASLKLVQLKLSKSMEYGDAVHMNRQQYKENVIRMSQSAQYTISIFNHIIEQRKTSLIIGLDNITGDYHTYLTQAKENMSSQLKKNKPKKVKLSTVETEDEVVSTLCTSNKEYNFAMAHLKLNASEKNELEIMKTVDKWVETIWNSVEQSALFVIVFGGTSTNNGVAMINIKKPV